MPNQNQNPGQQNQNPGQKPGQQQGGGQRPGQQQQDFLDIVGRKTALGQCRADVQAKFVPLPERDQGADHQNAASTMVEMRPGPDVRPGMSRDQIDEFRIE